MDGDRLAERRRIIRAHHPDRGGDPDVLIAELRRFDEQTRALQASSSRAHSVLDETTQPQWPVSLVTRLLRMLRRQHRASP